MNLLLMPVELLVKVCKYLNLNDRKSLAQTCSQVKEIVYLKTVWRNTTVFMDLPSQTDGYSSIYTSFERRGINSLHFTVTEYSHFDSHLALMATFWPSLFVITDETQIDADDFPGETGFLIEKTLLNVRSLKLCAVNHNFFHLLEDLFPSLLELDVSLTGFSDECAKILVRSKSKIEVLRASTSLLSNSGVGYLCGVGLRRQTDTDVPEEPLTSLRLLDISCCRSVTSDCFSLLERLGNLNTFYIGNNDLNLVTDLGYLASCVRLKGLIIQNHSDPETVLKLISESGFRLHCLSLDGNIEDKSIEAFKQGFSELRYLKLKSETITDKGMGALAKHLNQLIGVDLSYCASISKASILSIQVEMTSLKFLRILGCNNINLAEVASMNSQICYHSDSGYSKVDMGLDALKFDEEDSVWFRRVFFD